jgi:hypothetical protein
MLLRLVPPRAVPARLFITSDGMREKKMQDFKKLHRWRGTYCCRIAGPMPGAPKKKDDQA